MPVLPPNQQRQSTEGTGREYGAIQNNMFIIMRCERAVIVSALWRLATHDKYLRHFLLLGDGAAVLDGQDDRVRRRHERAAIHGVHHTLPTPTQNIHRKLLNYIGGQVAGVMVERRICEQEVARSIHRQGEAA